MVSHVVLQDLGVVTKEGAVPSQGNIFHCISVSYLPTGRVHEGTSVALYFIAPHRAAAAFPGDNKLLLGIPIFKLVEVLI